jgi:ribonuclease HI
MSCTAYFYGACTGNPGPMSIGFVVENPSNKVPLRFSTDLERRSVNLDVEDQSEKGSISFSTDLGLGTKNVAEYQALMHLLIYFYLSGISDFQIYEDSKLVVIGSTSGE